MDEFARSRGIPPDTLKTGIVLLGNFPLCIIFNRIPREYKHVFSIIASSLLFTLLFNPAGFLQLCALALTCYYLTKFLKSFSWGPVVVFVIAMGTLAGNHYYRQIYLAGENDVMDHTSPMMVMVMKLTAFAWSCYDGTRPDEV